MKNKWTLSLVAFLLMLAVIPSVYAQQHRKDHVDDYMAQKKAFLMKETQMSEQEAAQVFPLYIELQKKKFNLQREVRRELRAIHQQKGKISDETYRKASRMINDAKMKDAELENEYYQRFAKILTPQKLFLLQKAELDFHREVLKKLPAGSQKR